jgi:hypothetical protein
MGRSYTSGHEPERSSVTSSIDEFFENAAAFRLNSQSPARIPSKAGAIVPCMETRINMFTRNKLLDAPRLRARKFSPNQDRPPQFRS